MNIVPGSPLSAVARFTFSEGLNQVSRDNGKRSVVVQANVRGNDLGSFVAEAQATVASQVQLQPGTFIEWGGQFENLQAASRRLTIVIPIVFAAIFGVLFLALKGARPAIAVYSAIPLGLAGVCSDCCLQGYPSRSLLLSGSSCSQASGCGLVVMTAVNQRINAGLAVDRAMTEDILERFRAVLMTGIVPPIGFVPITLTLFVLPAISHLLLKGKHKHHVAGDYSDVDKFGGELVAT